MTVTRKTKLTVPGKHTRGKGWMLGKLDGRDSFNDGCAIYVGKPPRGTTCKIPNKAIAHVLKKARLKRLVPTEVTKVKGWGAIWTVFLKGHTAIDQKYHNFLIERFPDAKLYLGKKTEDGHSRYVFGKDKSGIVALIMPIRYPE